MGNHFSNRHCPNSNSMVSTAIPASKTTGPNQSIFVAIPKASLPQTRHPLELQDNAVVGEVRVDADQCAISVLGFKLFAGGPGRSDGGNHERD